MKTGWGDYGVLFFASYPVIPNSDLKSNRKFLALMTTLL